MKQRGTSTERFQGLAAIVAANKRCLLKYHETFRMIFGQPMQKYTHPLFGFDIIKFDDVLIKSGDNESCAEAVKRLFGDRGAKLIEDILKEDIT
jgi:hypothetical protein